MERRLTAIFAADVVGYSRLMGEDEVGTLARLTSCRREPVNPAIEACHGRIIKLMGDGAGAGVPPNLRCPELNRMSLVALCKSNANPGGRNMAKSGTSRGRSQDRAKVAGGQDHEVRYEAGKTGASKVGVK